MFLSSFEADPEEQRFGKAAIHLRTLVFGRLSDDHVLALALLPALGSLYRRAYSTDQVLPSGSARRGSQEEALAAHLYALGLPSNLTELEPCEVQGLIDAWEGSCQALPRPFDGTLRAFLVHARAHLSAAPTPTVPTGYEAR
jgi:hypothetical protein